MKKICIIPLDSRPCNTVWLEHLANEAGLETVMYPRALCGTLHRGANFFEMMAMIEDNIADGSYLLISADGLCSGGLVQARLGEIDVEAVISRLKVFADYKKRYPDLKIYFFDTLMRTSITAYDKESSRYWALVNEYSRLYGRYHYGCNHADYIKLQALEKLIPQALLSRYLRARQIKHRLNMHFLEWANQGIIDYLIILQEDASPEGIQKIEQEKIANYISDNKLETKVKTYNGTDEGGLLLLARIINEQYRLNPQIYLHRPYPDALNKIMLFEDRPFILNLEGMFKTVGFRFAADYNTADFILAVYTEKENYDLNLNRYQEVLPDKTFQYYRFIGELNDYLKTEKKVALVDLLFPNGGSPELLKAIDYKALQVYSAWNTASNAMGSALCEIAVLSANPKVNHNAFKYNRIMDDCIYQYDIRRKINQDLLADGYNIFDLKEHAAKVLARIAAEMEKYRFLVENRRFKLSLPWNRTFEIDIEVED
ncbi:MAG: DUF4127 family protein [Bacilli bacterium]|nr:DUF4127 family protein [Bacilli bacterium]MDD4077342.1 DUF4127 family protein [Bacilli bacterium]MDD4387688.1 DUF4127 family protein [Bacilli bacterium]